MVQEFSQRHDTTQGLSLRRIAGRVGVRSPDGLMPLDDVGKGPVRGGGAGILDRLPDSDRDVGRRVPIGEAIALDVRLVPVDNSLIFINFMNRLRAKRTDSLTNRFFLLSIRPI